MASHIHTGISPSNQANSPENSLYKQRTIPASKQRTKLNSSPQKIHTLKHTGFKLTLKTVADTSAISTMTVKRLYTPPTSDRPNNTYDSRFPEPERNGRSVYIDSDAFYQWLSHKAGFKVVYPDKALTTKQLRVLFSKSHTWLWQNVKNGALPQPFKIGRLNFWMASQFDVSSDLEGQQ